VKAGSMKLLGVLLVSALWLLVYFGCQNVERRRPALLQPSRLDNLVPRREWPVWLYLLAYIYPYTLLLLLRGPTIEIALRAFAVLIVAAGAIYILFPTRVIRLHTKHTLRHSHVDNLLHLPLQTAIPWLRTPVPPDNFLFSTVHPPALCH